MTTKEIKNVSDQVCDFFKNIEDGDEKAVRDFINDNNDIAPFDNENNESAAAVALRLKQLAIYEVLISKGWWFNSSENITEIVDKLEKKLRKELLEINEKSKQNPNELTSLVDTFLDRNRYLFAGKEEETRNEKKSALASKIILLLPKKSNIKDIAYQLYYALKSELLEIHIRNGISNPNEEHLLTLISQSRIYFGESSAATRNRPKYLNLIAGAYEQLNEIPEIQEIFKVVANIKNLNIIFEFKRDAIHRADPTANEDVTGKCYKGKQKILIGAKALDPKLDAANDDEVTRSDVLGTIAHELCHAAILHIYNNDYKPYHENDSEGEEEFESVLQDCVKNHLTEYIIGLVFSGDEEAKRVRHDELIVRVPHLLAFYQGDDKKIQSLKEKFPMLFDYFEKKILPDLKKENESMSGFWKLKSKEPQNLIESEMLFEPEIYKLDLDAIKVLEVSSNCPQMTMNWIFQKIMSQPNFLFITLKHLNNSETYKLMLKAHSSCMKPRVVIDCDNKTEKEIKENDEKMRKDKIKERIIFIHNYKDHLIEGATARKFSHSWLDLTKESKENLINIMVSFQGKNIILEDIVDLHCDALEFVPLKELLGDNLKIGKELELPETDIHVERKFLNAVSTVVESNDLIHYAKTSKTILLSDDPGMGKTTELKMLAVAFKEEIKNFWVAFVDLKEHFQFYEKDENFKTIFNSSGEIATFFAKKIFQLNEFEERVFKHLFRCNRVLLLLDGFDEICPTFNKFVTMMIRSIKTHSGNILITSTRPQFKNELCTVLNTEAYSLMPLTEENCFEILEKNLEKKGITAEELKKKIDKTKEFFINLKKSSDLKKNPLILRMIAKVFMKDQFAKVMKLNIFSIYENFVFTMIEESMDKGFDAKLELRTYVTSGFNIILFYQKEAFKVLFENDNYCFDLCFDDDDDEPEEQVTKVALMKSDDSGKFHFIHRTFAEYFVADFLFMNAFALKALKERKKKNPMLKERLEAIYEKVRFVFDQYYHYLPVRSFLDGAFEKLIPLPKMIEKKDLMSTFSEIFTRHKMQKYFQNFLFENLIKLVTVMTRCADTEELKRLWTYKDNSGNNHFMNSARWNSLYFNKELTQLAREIFDEQEFMNFFTEKNIRGDTVASTAFHDSKIPDVIDFYCDTNIFTSSYGLHIAELAKLNLFLFDRNISGFHKRLERIKEDFGLKYLQKVLSSTSISGDTIYVEVCRTISTVEDFEKLWNFLRNILGDNDFKTLLLKPDSDGTTPLMWKGWLKSSEVFVSFWKLLSEILSISEQEIILTDKDNDGKNLFDWATLAHNCQKFVAIKDLYLTTFGKNKSILLTKESKYGLGVLWFSVPYFDGNVAIVKTKTNGFKNKLCSVHVEKNFTTLKELWSFIQEICDLSTQKTILMRTDKNGKTFLEWYLRNRDTDARTKIFEQFIEQHFTTVEKEEVKVNSYSS